VLIGAATADDAAVYRISDDLALVFTVDYFTPVVDDPEAFGAITAANALSDVYAMGGRPVLALNLAGFPSGDLPLSMLEAILRGGAGKAAEAGVSIVGGHTIDDPEPKYGMAVIGFVHPERVLANVGAQPGDVLILTKPLGVGVITTAIKRGSAPEEAARAAVESMATLNRSAAEALEPFTVHACTDITGFGLIGHLYEMVSGSGVGAEVYARAVPLLPGALSLAREGVVPGGTHANRQHFGAHVTWDPAVDEATQLLLCDAQTSGGLLVSVPEVQAPDLLEALQQTRTLAAAPVGRVVPGPAGQILVRGSGGPA
jgi:selenide,water dikinase